jgi:hypothetical protein
MNRLGTDRLENGWFEHACMRLTRRCCEIEPAAPFLSVIVFLYSNCFFACYYSQGFDSQSFTLDTGWG